MSRDSPESKGLEKGSGVQGQAFRGKTVQPCDFALAASGEWEMSPDQPGALNQSAEVTVFRYHQGDNKGI